MPEQPERARRWTPPRTPLRLRLRYAWRWTWGLLRFSAWRTRAVLLGQRSKQARAVRVRQLFEGMGPVGALVGRQLAMRLDLVGLDMSLELAELRDDAPPMPIEAALARIEQLTGSPSSAMFSSFGPEVVASSAISCTWRAVLLDGRRVTVRLRRPGAAEELAAAFRMLPWVTGLFEGLALIEPGLYERVRHELDNALRDDLDLRWAGRLQLVLADRLQRDRLRGVTTPAVLAGWLSDELLVAEDPGGVSLLQVASAVERGDRQALEAWAAQGIHPERLARSLLEFGWWEQFEAMFFTAEPDIDRFVVLPGGQLCLTMMEDCDIVPRRLRRLVREALTCLSEDDVPGAADALVRAMAPLPRVDVHELNRKLALRLSDALHRSRNPGAPWVWRTTLGLWVALFDTTAELGVSVRLDLSRAIRAEATNSLLAGRLWPEIDLWSAWDHHRARAQKRALRAAVRRSRITRVRRRVARAVQYLRAQQMARRSLLLLDALVDTPPIDRQALPAKGAYVVTVGMRAVAVVVGSTGGLVAARMVWGERSLAEALMDVVTHPGWAAPMMVLALVVVRLILFRLDDLEAG